MKAIWVFEHGDSRARKLHFCNIPVSDRILVRVPRVRSGLGKRTCIKTWDESASIDSLSARRALTDRNCQGRCRNPWVAQPLAWTATPGRAIPAGMKKGDHLFLVDGSGYIFRAYHALPPLNRKSDGLPTSAVLGFCNMVWKLMQDARNTSVGIAPTHFAVIFDYSSKTFRSDLYPEYKANRSAPPEDLIPQFGLIRQATVAFNVPCI